MGKHVLCEKSMAMTVAAAQRMLDAAQENHVVLMMAYRMPFDSSLQRVYEALRANELGTIKQVNSSISFNVPDGWRLQRALSGGGALMDLGIYPIHTLCWLLQQDPVTVQGHAWSTDPRRFQEVEESVAFRLEFSQGLQAQCAASYGVTDHSALFIGGDKGWISMSSVYDFDKNIVQQTLTEGNSGIQTEMITRGEDVGSMLDAFAQSIQTGRVLPDCSGERGLRDQHILAALYQSMALRQPIDLVEMLPESVLPLT
jgi:predicted dehydrogenase